MYVSMCIFMSTDTCAYVCTYARMYVHMSDLFVPCPDAFNVRKYSVESDYELLDIVKSQSTRHHE